MFSSVYCFLSLDETAGFHEMIDTYMAVKWVLLYAPFAGIFFMVCLSYVMVIRNRDKSLCTWILGGVVVYTAGGLVCEAVNCVVYPLSPALQHVEFMIEEGLELVGTIMALTGCLNELNHLGAGLEIGQTGRHHK